MRAGTGGEEAALWAADLIRMYQKYADAQVKYLLNPTKSSRLQECKVHMYGACWVGGVGGGGPGLAVGAGCQWAGSHPAFERRSHPEWHAPWMARYCTPLVHGAGGSSQSVRLGVLCLVLSHAVHAVPAAPLVQSWKTSLVSESLAESGGYKECILQITGDRCAFVSVCLIVIFLSVDWEGGLQGVHPADHPGAGAGDVGGGWAGTTHGCAARFREWVGGSRPVPTRCC